MRGDGGAETNLAIDTVGDSRQEPRMEGGSKWDLAAAGGEDAGALVCLRPARKGFDVAGADGVMGMRKVAEGFDGYPVSGEREGVADDERTGAAAVSGLGDEDDVPGAADDLLLRKVRPYTLLLPLATLRVSLRKFVSKGAGRETRMVGISVPDYSEVVRSLVLSG